MGKNSVIEVTGIKIGEFKVPVPVGLSELLNDGDVWKKKSPSKLKGYIRSVEMREGKIFSVLKKEA